jgi:hypothetical protein
MITDDPGTPGDGHWEINMAALANRTPRGNSYQLPLLDINYGLGDRLQFKYEVPWVVDAGRSVSGLGNSLLGVKWRFYDAGASGWQVSTYPQVQFNTPSSASPRRGLADPGTSYLLPLEIARSYSSLDINFEVGRWLRPAALADTWIAGAVIGREVRKSLEAIAELRVEANTGITQAELIANVGCRWDLSKRYTLLISAGRDLQNHLGPANTFFSYLGVQFHR